MISVRASRPDASAAARSERVPMIDSVRMKNFRCFEEHFIEGLGTVNILVGDNGSGKTALLEALFLSQIGHPEVITRMRLWRGLSGQMAIARTRGSYEGIW